MTTGMLSTHELNDIKIQYGMERWGTSEDGEPTWVTIEVTNGKPRITDILLQPEGLKYSAPFNADERICSLHLKQGVSDAAGEVFIYPSSDKGTELLSISIRAYTWHVEGEAHASLAVLTHGTTISDHGKTLLVDLFSKAMCMTRH